jgi:hypothetical protein
MLLADTNKAGTAAATQHETTETSNITRLKKHLKKSKKLKAKGVIQKYDERSRRDQCWTCGI